MNSFRFLAVFLFLALSFAFTVCGAQTVAWAQQGTESAFFNTMPDIPLMPGLSEMEDQSVVFDKAEGRIIEMSAYVKEASQKEVLSYYARTLPQLGWNALGGNRYRREGEILSISFETIDGAVYAKFMVSP